MRTLLSMIAVSMMLVPGCEPDDGLDEDADEIEFRPLGGVWLNTSSIGPLTLSQFDLTGQVLDGMALTDVFIQGPGGQWPRLDSVEVTSGGELRGRIGSTSYTGADLVGSRWVLDPDQGSPVEMWISAYTPISPRETRYTFKTIEAGQEVYVCAPGPGGDYSAIPVKNIVVNHQTGVINARANTLFLACVSGAVGKAYTWGYDPQTSGVNHFEVAVRMVRADYCYNGESWTTSGTGIQVRDKWSLTAFLNPDRSNEGVWTPSGLACLTQPRNPAYTASQVTCNGAPKPTCPANVGMQTYTNSVFWTKLADQ